LFARLHVPWLTHNEDVEPALLLPHALEHRLYLAVDAVVACHRNALAELGVDARRGGGVVLGDGAFEAGLIAPCSAPREPVDTARTKKTVARKTTGSS
jgi:hypothetical protein